MSDVGTKGTRKIERNRLNKEGQRLCQKQQNKGVWDMRNIELKNVSFSYGSKPILSNVSCEIAPGITNVIGINGAGKSTLIKLISKRKQCDKGEIVIPGKVSIISDYVKIPDDIKLGSIMNEAMLQKLTGLNDYLKIFEENKSKVISKLSTGQKKVVEILFAISQGNKVILCDEITSGLDYHNTQEILKVINELSKREDCFVLFISHQIEDYLQLNTKNYLFIDGRKQQVKNVRISKKEDIIHLISGYYQGGDYA